MNTRNFEEFDSDIEFYQDPDADVPEASPTTKLERRRKIEDLFEEKRLREELADF
jgi:hypothetical protein